jgi:hypothetical protein
MSSSEQDGPLAGVRVDVRVTQSEAMSGSPGLRFALGTILVIAGLACAIAGVRDLRHAVHPLEDVAMSEFLLGLCVLTFGAATFGQPIANVRQRFLGALAVTSMALLFDWIAFVPGPRAFHAGASASHPGQAVSSTVGRVAFGIGAVLFDLAAVYAWRVAIRALGTVSGIEQPRDANLT